MNTVDIDISRFSETSQSYNLTFKTRKCGISVFDETGMEQELRNGNKIRFNNKPNGSYSWMYQPFFTGIIERIYEKLGEQYLDKIDCPNPGNFHLAKKKFLTRVRETNLNRALPDWGPSSVLNIPILDASYLLVRDWEITIYYLNYNKTILSYLYPIRKDELRCNIGFDGRMITYGDPIDQITIPDGTTFKIDRINLFGKGDQKKSNAIITIDQNQPIRCGSKTYILKYKTKVNVNIKYFDNLPCSINLNCFT